MSAREAILARVGHALRDVPPEEQPADVEVPRLYRRTESGDLVARFVERLVDYGTTVRHVDAADVPDAVADACRARGAVRLAVPAGMPLELTPSGIELVDGDQLDLSALDEIDGALTGCALAIAETGTIVLDGGVRQGTRRLTLVPDFHICLVEESQIVGGVPEGLRVIATTLRRDRRPFTFISGPSATSDIEFSRVEGVHGPRMLVVVVVRR